MVSALCCLQAFAQCPSTGPSTTTSVPTPDSQSFSTSFNSSNYGGNIMNYSDLAMFNQAAETLAENTYHDIEGSPFMTEEFVKGILVTTEGDVILDVPLKINVYTQEVIAKNHLGSIVVLDQTQYQELILPFEGKDLRFKRINQENPDVFYEVLFESAELTMIKEHYATVKESNSNGISSTPKKFSQRTRYYVMQENGLAVKTRLNKKSLLALLPNTMANDLEAYADLNKIKFSKESELMRLLAGYTYEQTLAGKNN